jgi:predicted SAM-dependent methyltransferase
MKKILRKTIRRYITTPIIIKKYLGENRIKKLHIGAGNNYLLGWLNMDFRSKDPRIVYVNAKEPFPFSNDVFDYIFNEHFFEHLEYPHEAEIFLKECLRIMKPGGVGRIGVPDTEYAIKAYIENNKDYFDTCRKLWHPQYCTTKMESINFHFRQKGQHKFAYDYETLEKIIIQSGFTDVIKSKYNSSDNEELRVDNWSIPGTLYVEFKKRGD